jgi:hydrogenase maturation factor
MKTIEYWAVEETYDRDSKEIGNFSNQAAAEEVATKDNKMYRGVYKLTLTLFDSVEDFENNSREKIRERALAKLTIEERNALGVK